MSPASTAWPRVRSLLPVRAAAVARDPRRDLLAGPTVAIVALPLALDLVYAVVIDLAVAGAPALRAVAEQARSEGAHQREWRSDDWPDMRARLPGDSTSQPQAVANIGNYRGHHVVVRARG
ncbi:hypothetical protein [Streptomyces sp. NPDC008122]|uniref:hypothetical protein n=1 Tax=Streptomyces sp. NPDC008122 TaxID=3364810 RepID=UPI0036E6AC21